MSYEEIEAKNYSLSAGQYFEVKIEYIEISSDEFSNELGERKKKILDLFEHSRLLESEINNQLSKLTL